MVIQVYLLNILQCRILEREFRGQLEKSWSRRAEKYRNLGERNVKFQYISEDLKEQSQSRKVKTSRNLARKNKKSRNLVNLEPPHLSRNYFIL